MNEDTFHLGIKALVKNSEGKILLLKVNKEELTGFDGEAYWDLPGGRIQRGSSIEDTLIREIEEETGIKSISSIRFVAMGMSNIRIPVDGSEDVGLILSIYECEMDKSEKINLSFEHTNFEWFSPKDAAEKLQFKFSKEMIEKIAELK